MIYPPAFLVRAVLTMFTFYQQSKDHLSHYTTQPSQTSGCYCGNKQHFCSNELCIPLTGSDSSAANTLLTLTPLICQYIYTSPTDAQRATVVRLDWYKYTNGLEHEFILATLVRKDNLDRKYYLRFERRATHHANVCEKNMLKEENIEVSFYIHVRLSSAVRLNADAESSPSPTNIKLNSEKTSWSRKIPSAGYVGNRERSIGKGKPPQTFFGVRLHGDASYPPTESHGMILAKYISLLHTTLPP